MIRSRYRGCLLGGAVGDALGAPVEFLKRREILARYGPRGIVDYASAFGRIGAITDDTQMTLFTAEGMMRAWVRMLIRGIGPAFKSVTARAYLRWLMTQGHRSDLLRHDMPGWLIGHRELFSRRAPGNTCLSTLVAMRKIDDRARNDSKGCGGVMRVTPVGLFTAHFFNKPADKWLSTTFRLGTDIAAITHGHPTGQLTAGVLALVTALLMRGESLSDALAQSKRELRNYPSFEESFVAIEKAEALAKDRPADPDALSTLGGGWIAEEALAIGVFCALSAPDFESGITLAINHDGDSDSTGAIAGNLLGVMHGVESIPKRWLDPLELREVIEEIADDLATVLEWRVAEFSYSPECEFYWNRYPGC